jgi:hexokinase
MSPTEFCQKVISDLSVLGPSDLPALLRTSDKLLESFQDALRHAGQTMLPSYISSLPTGSESGMAVGVDLGGSTLRVAVIRLQPHEQMAGDDKEHFREPRNELASQKWIVGDEVKRLRSKLFFDWMVERIADVVEAAGMKDGLSVPVGLTWSFPVE